MREVVGKIRGYKVLLYLGEKVVLAKRNKIYLSDLSLQELEYKCTVGCPNILVRIISHFRLLQRLFRLELGPATHLNEKHCFLVFYRNQVFHVNVALSQVTQEFVPELKHRPLQLTTSKLQDTPGAVYFGEYTANYKYESVNIYKREHSGVWSVVFRFPAGQINHIHGIFEDVMRNCLYILTGDFEQGAGIWLSNILFTDVRPLLRSGQSSRACWVFPWGRRLVFATDKQDEHNYLCEIDNLDDATASVKFPIVGSSIFFSGAHTDQIIFSTAVEPPSNNQFSIVSLFTKNRADGMLSDRSCIYLGSPEKGFEIIFSGEKDSLPYNLFQLGNISFPNGDSGNKNLLHFYCTALKNSDNTTYAMRINKEKGT